MQGLIDQMAAGVARIDALGLTLRDIERGLVDFPALVTGRQVWLCWRLGETADRLVARPRDGLRRPAAAGRAGMTGALRRRRPRRAGARPTGRSRPADRAAALEAGLAAYERGDFFEAHELLEPAWMGTDVPAERALLQGLIKLAAAYVHGVRGNPAGIARNLEGARARLLEADEDRLAAGQPRAVAGRPGARRRDRPPARRPRGPSGRPTLGTAPPARSPPMSQPGAASRRSTSPRPTGGSARTRPGRSCSTSASRTSSPRSARRVRSSCRRRCFIARVGELPADRPLLVICATGGRSAAVTGYLLRTGRTDVVNVAGGMDAWERAGLAGPERPVEPGEGDAPAAADRDASAARRQDPAR